MYIYILYVYIWCVCVCMFRLLHVLPPKLLVSPCLPGVALDRSRMDHMQAPTVYPPVRFHADNHLVNGTTLWLFNIAIENGP